ncbi:MAG: hypothetical protein ACKOCB_01685 [Planctomycetia bacterium]
MRTHRPGWSRPLVWLLAVCAAAWAVTARVGWSEEAPRERLFVFFDCSGSMGKKDGTAGQSRFDEALEWAMADVSVELRVGVEVFIIPFDTKPLGLEQGGGLGATPRPRSFLRAASDDSARAEADARAYLARFNPGSAGGGGTAIWDTVQAFVPLLKSDARGAKISIYTDGEDTNSQVRREVVEQQLIENRDPSERAGREIRVWTWAARRMAPPAVAISLLDRETLLTASAFGADESAEIKVRVRAEWSGAQDPRDSVDRVEVRAARSSKAAAPEVVGARLGAPLTRAAPEGVAYVRFKGRPAAGEHRYVLDFVFEAAWEREKKAERRTLRAASPHRVRITSSPAIEARAAIESLDLLAGESREVRISLSGNADAAGQACVVRAVTPPGVVVEFAPEDDPAALGPQGTAVILPDGAPTGLLARISSGEATTAGTEIVLSAAIPGATSDTRIRLSVRAPMVRVMLARPQASTELAETIDATQGSEAWTELACGPLGIDVGALAGRKLKARLSVDRSGPMDVAIGLGPSQASELVVDLDNAAAAATRLHARWQGTERPSTLRIPAIQVELIPPVLDGVTLRVEPARIAMAGRVHPSAPDLRLRALTAGPVSVPPGGELVTDWIVEWSSGARGSTLSVEPTVAGDGQAGTVSLLGRDEGLSAAADVPAAFRVADGDPREGRLRATGKAPTASGRFDVELRATLRTPLGATVERTATLPVVVEPPSIEVDASGAAGRKIVLLPGVDMSLGKVKAACIGPACDLRVTCELEGADACPVEARFGDEGGSGFGLPAFGVGERDVFLRAALDAPTGKPLRLVLVLLAGGNAGTLVRAPGQPPAATVRVPVEATVDAPSIIALHSGFETSVLPRKGAWSIEDQERLETIKFKTDFHLALKRSMDELPPSLAAAQVTCSLTKDGDLVRAVEFARKDGTPLGTTVTAGDLATQELDLIVWLRSDRPRGWIAGSDRVAVMELRCDAPEMVTSLKLRLYQKPSFSLMIVILAVVVLLWIVRKIRNWRRKKQQEKTALATPPAAPEALDTGAISLDDDLPRGPGKATPQGGTDLPPLDLH